MAGGALPSMVTALFRIRLPASIEIGFSTNALQSPEASIYGHTCCIFLEERAKSDLDQELEK